MHQAIQYLLAADKKLHPVILRVSELSISTKPNIYLHLCQSIMSQQLSTKVATVIYNRFLALYDNKTPTLKSITQTPNEQLRAIGLSNAKVAYVKNVCEFFITHKITDKRLHAMDNDSIIELLTQIKGVGQWTVEMILMFALGREDVFALDDLGIQQAMCSLYKINPDNKKQLKAVMLKKAQKWQPYRTYACLYLWRFKDG